jgi:hypothetical protein
MLLHLDPGCIEVRLCCLPLLFVELFVPVLGLLLWEEVALTALLVYPVAAVVCCGQVVVAVWALVVAVAEDVPVVFRMKPVWMYTAGIGCVHIHPWLCIVWVL